MKCRRFENKLCLVTGSTTGIGLAIAHRLGEEGAFVIIASRKEENSKRAEDLFKSKNIKYDNFVCDFNSKDQRKLLSEEIMKKYGKLDVLVCCVSKNVYMGPALEISEKEFYKIFETNVKNTFYTIIQFMELLKKGSQANILLVSSQSGYRPYPYLGIFSISKTAIFAMTKVLAEELAKYNIKVNCVAPGVMLTKGGERLDPKFAKSNFLQRYANLSELSGTAAFLCSKDSGHITGEIICVNGGMYSRL